MSTAQLIFSIALAAITVIITVFSIYVVTTTFRTDRWIRKPSDKLDEK